MSAFEENEISKNAFGGTEIAKRKLAKLVPEELLEDFQIICSRVRDLDETKIRIYWPHDLPEDPECIKLKDESFRRQFHHFVYISNWQYSRFQLVANMPYNVDNTVIDSGIDPIDWVEKPKDKIRLVYSSTPQRGLDILLPVFEKLCEKHNNIELDVFSSFKIYGWDSADKEFEPLYDRIRNHPKMNYHGFVPNDVLQEHLKTSHIHAYPSTWIETSCRAMLEAMSAGMICVHPNYGALYETSGGLNFMYQGDENKNVHAAKFYHALDFAIENVNTQEMQDYTKFVKSYTDHRYAWNRISADWIRLLTELKAKYPTVESRKILKDEDMFIYKA
jgi:glycosyltransferase involved in cell wall biosynthesis